MKLLRIGALLFLCLAGCVSAGADVVISEVGASNHCVYFDAAGETPDWVELHNDGVEAVALDGWYLSDSQAGKHALPLDGVTLAPGEYRLIALGDDAGWGLSAQGETVYLCDADGLRQQVPYPALEQDVSYARLAGEYVRTWLPTPGMENRLLAEGEPFSPAAGVRLSETLTSAAPYGGSDGFDYVELINTGKTCSLKGWQLRLGMAGSRVCALPDKALGKGDLFALYCTGDYILKTANAGFNLPAQGAILSLWTPDNELADLWRLPGQYANVAYGLSGDGQNLGYLSAASFGRRNGTAWRARTEAPTLSLPGGVYQEAVTVTVSVPEGATVHYTTDGTVPTQASPVYEGPLTLDETVALRAAAFRPGELASADAAATYVLRMEADFPIVSLIIDKKYLYDARMGVITGKTGDTPNYRFNWEYPANFEYFGADGGSLMNQRCGFGIQGDSSRGNRQKAFKLIARKSYGTPDTFDFNPFPHREFDSYKSFNLRAAGSEGPDGVRFRDACLSSLAEGTSLLYADAQPVLVLLNGEIYGHYNLRERLNKYCVAQHAGITDEDVIRRIDILSEDGDWVRNGSNQDYKFLSHFMRTHDLNEPQNLGFVQEQMDVQSYFEYVAFMMCTGNMDLSNTRFYRVPGGKWRWMLYDLDRGMEEADHVAAFWLYTLPMEHERAMMTDHVPFVALMRVPEMREQFLATLGQLLRTRFAPEVILPRIDAWHGALEKLMPYQLARWTQEKMHYWEYQVKQMRSCALQRPGYVIDYAVRYLGVTEEELARYFN